MVKNPGLTLWLNPTMYMTRNKYSLYIMSEWQDAHITQMVQLFFFSSDLDSISEIPASAGYPHIQPASSATVNASVSSIGHVIIPVPSGNFHHGPPSTQVPVRHGLHPGPSSSQVPIRHGPPLPNPCGSSYSAHLNCNNNNGMVVPKGFLSGHCLSNIPPPIKSEASYTSG